MAGSEYKFEHSGSKSDEFFPLNKDIVNDETTGVPQDAPKTFRNKFTRFTKNILKSSKNLAVDVVGAYLPNTKEFGSSLNETRSILAANARDKMNKARDLQKKYSEGGNAEAKKDPIGYASKTASDTFNDVKARLKSGDFYHTADENMTMDDGFGDLGGGFDDGDFATTDSYELGSPETTLSEEPFGDTQTVSKRRVVKGTSNTRARNGNRRNKKMIKGVSSSEGQLRLGDEYVAQTASAVGTAVIAQSDKVWAKQMAVDELRHTVHMQFQKDILKGVNAISAHLEKVEGTTAAASMEYQGKSLAMQQDVMMLLKELKQAVIVTSPEYVEYQKSKSGKILNNGGILNGGEYAKNIQGNVSDLINSSPLGMLLGMAPMLGMAKDMGGSTKFDPLSMVVKSGVNGMLSQKTRGQLGKFDDMMSSAGGSLVGKMNDLAKYGNSKPAQVIGKIFGVKDSYARQANMGLADPTAQVAWNAKNDRTLNEVIPDRLSKIVAALTGKEEESYDYKTGGFRTQSSVRKEYERVKQEADVNPILDRYKDQMTSLASKSSLATSSELSEGEIKSDFAKIMENASRSNRGINSSRFNNPKYMADLTKGTKHKESAVLFTQMYEKMSPDEQTIFSGQLVKQNAVRSDKILQHEQDLIQNGGAASLSRIKNNDQVAMLENYLAESVDTDTNIDPNSPLYMTKLKKRRDTEKEIERLKAGGIAGSTVSAVSVGVDGMSTEGAEGSTSTTMIGSLNNIFSLLSKGIIVFPKNLGEGETPDHLLKIEGANKARSEKAATDKALADQEARERSDRILDYDKTMAKRTREQRVLGRAGIGDYIGATNNEFKTKNAVNQGVARATNGAMKWTAGILGNPNAKSGEGLFDTSEFDQAILDQRKNAAQYLDPAMAKLKSTAEGGKGIRAKLAKSAYDNLQKRQASLNNVNVIEGYDPKTGIIHKPGEGTGKLSRFNAKAHKKFLNMYGKYVSSTGQTVDTSTPEGEAAYLDWLKNNGGSEFNDPRGMPREQFTGSPQGAEPNPNSGEGYNLKTTPFPKPHLFNDKGPNFQDFSLNAQSTFSSVGDKARDAYDSVGGLTGQKIYKRNKKGEIIRDKYGMPIEIVDKKKKGIIRHAIPVALGTMAFGPAGGAAVAGFKLAKSAMGKSAIAKAKAKAGETRDAAGNVIHAAANSESASSIKNTLFTHKEQQFDPETGEALLDKKGRIVMKKKKGLIRKAILPAAAFAVGGVPAAAAVLGARALRSKFGKKAVAKGKDALESNSMFQKISNKVLGIKEGDKKTSREKKEEHQLALNTYQALLTIYTQLEATNPTVDMTTIKDILAQNVKRGILDKDIVDAIVKEMVKSELTPDTPLVTFKLIIDMLRRKYDSSYRKGKIKNSLPMKMIKGVLSGGLKAGLGIGALLTGNPLVAGLLIAREVGKNMKLGKLRKAGRKRDKQYKIDKKNGLFGHETDYKSPTLETQDATSAPEAQVATPAPSATPTARREGGLMDNILDKKESTDEKQDNEVIDVQKKILETLQLTQAGLGINKNGEIDEKNKESIAGLVSATSEATAYTAENGGGSGGGVGDAVTGMIGDKVMGKVGGKVGGKLLGKIGGKVGGKLGGKLAGMGAGMLAKGAGGTAAKLAGGIAAKGALGTVAKFAGPVGLALTLAQAGYGGFKGWNNASNIAGLQDGQKASTGQKVGAAASGALSSLTMGLIKPEQMYGAGKAIGKVGGKIGKGIGKGIGNIGHNLFGADVDENGEYQKPGFGKSALRAASMLVPGVAPAMLIAKLANSKKNKAAKAAAKAKADAAKAGDPSLLDKAGTFAAVAGKTAADTVEDARDKVVELKDPAKAKLEEAKTGIAGAGAVAVAAGKATADAAAKKASEAAVELKSKSAKAKAVATDAAADVKKKADALIGKTVIDKSITAEREKPKTDKGPIPGSTTANPVKLKENPYMSNDKEFTKTITETLQTQKQIKDEMVRHNGLTEEFFSDLKTILEGMVGHSLKMDEKQDKKDKQAKQGGFFSGITNLLAGKDGSTDPSSGASLDSARDIMMQSLNSNANTVASGG